MSVNTSVLIKRRKKIASALKVSELFHETTDTEFNTMLSDLKEIAKLYDKTLALRIERKQASK